MMILMLSSFLKSALPQRFLFPQRRRFRDCPAAKTKSNASPVRLLSFLVGGLLLASVVLMMAAALRAPSSVSAHAEAVPARAPAAAIAAGQAAAVVAAATDGRSVTDLHESASAEKMPEPIIATIDRNCAAHAREKLMVGLTNYYLQRRLRPGATSDDAAETSSLTGVLAGPGDPVAATPESSCKV